MSRPPTVWFSFSQVAGFGQAASEGRTRVPGDGDGEVAPADPVKCGQRADKIGSVERRLRKDFRVMVERTANEDREWTRMANERENGRQIKLTQSHQGTRIGIAANRRRQGYVGQERHKRRKRRINTEQPRKNAENAKRGNDK